MKENRKTTDTRESIAVVVLLTLFLHFVMNYDAYFPIEEGSSKFYTLIVGIIFIIADVLFLFYLKGKKKIAVDEK